MILQAVGTEPAIGIKEAIHRIKDGRLFSIATNGKECMVERTFHIVGGGECRAAHPDHSETAVVGGKFARRGGVEKLW